MPPFETRTLPREPTITAPDGSDVRMLATVDKGSMAHFELACGRTSAAVQHRTVDELWYVVGGQAQMWRKLGDLEEVVLLQAGTSLSIPVGTQFQFRAVGTEPFCAVGTTMPPWPGPDEAILVQGPWQAS